MPYTWPYSNSTLLNSLRPRLNRRPFADDILKCIFFNENEWILPRISLKFVPKVRINNIPALVYYYYCVPEYFQINLTQWGRVTHICVGKLTITGSDNGLSPGRRQAIIWTNAKILSIGPVGTNFSEIVIEIYTFSFKKMRLKISSAKWRPCCLGVNVLR